jgi:Uma2 family endonuclease
VGTPSSDAARGRRYTLAEYLEIEELSPAVKHELVDGEIYAVAGGTPEHAALSTALSATLLMQLRDGPCRAYSSDLRLRIRTANVATYADVAVVCGSVERDPDSPTHVTNPRLVVEVLSPSTEDYDREEKRLLNQQLPSLHAYLLVAQDRRRLELWQRESETWVASVHEVGARVQLDAIGVSLDVDELYALAGVDVP